MNALLADGSSIEDFVLIAVRDERIAADPTIFSGDDRAASQRNQPARTLNPATKLDVLVLVPEQVFVPGKIAPERLADDGGASGVVDVLRVRAVVEQAAVGPHEVLAADNRPVEPTPAVREAHAW